MRRKRLNISDLPLALKGLGLRVYESRNWILDLLNVRETHYLPKFLISYDVELTNACNTACVFCPIDKTGKKGFMDFNTFKKAIHRTKESGVALDISSAGLGEPLLHREVVDFVRFVTDEGLDYSITTNASLLKRELANELIDAGLKGIFFSVSGINNTYEEIHRLNFKVTKRNILDFIDVSHGRCRITITIVICDENRNEIDQIIGFWKKNGISRFWQVPMMNRGGGVDVNLSYLESERRYHQAVEILKSNNISTICWQPFLHWFIGWDGNYYLCCNEYGRKLPLGNVFDKSMREIGAIIERSQLDNPNICRKCDVSPINRITHILFRIEREEAKPTELDSLIKLLKTFQVEATQVKNELLRKN